MRASSAQGQTDRRILDEGLARRLARVPGEAGGRLVLPKPSPGGETALIGCVGDGDPLVGAEEAVAKQDPAAILRGLGALALVARSRRVVLAVRDDLTRLLATLRRLAEGTVVHVVPVPAVYPQDDASVRCDVAQSLERRPAAFADALVVRAVVLGDVARALDGEAMGHRWVSVSGAVRRPVTRLFPLGCRVEDAVAAAGGATENVWVAYENGLISGRRVGADDVIDVATRALVVLPPDHPRIQDASVPLADRVRQAASSCVQCRLCTEGCPVWLTGGHLEPHLVMRHLLRSFGGEGDAPQDEASSLATLQCLGCRSCTLRCPAGIDPARLVAAVGQRLRSAGVTLGTPSWPLAPRPGRSWRRLSAEGLRQYYRPLVAVSLPIDDRPYAPSHLVFPLRDPEGHAREALAGRGDVVRRGTLLLRGGVGAVDIHAPRAGVIETVDPDLGMILRCR